MKSSGIEPRSSRRWTVVIVRRFGRISSHEISGFWFKMFVFLMILIIAGAVYLFYENQRLTEERQRLLARLVLPPTETEADKPVLPAPKPATTTTLQVEKEADKKKPAEKDKQKEEEVSSTSTTEVEVTTTLQAAVTSSLESTTTTEPVEATTTTTAAPETQAQAQDDAVTSEKVNVSEVKVVTLQNPRGIKVAYKLLNKSPDGKKIAGYTFVLARNDELEKPVVEVFPNTATLEEGQPVDHKKGVAFSIFQFKTIRGRIYTQDPIKEVQILVYDQDGELLYSQSYPVPNA